MIKAETVRYSINDGPEGVSKDDVSGYIGELTLNPVTDQNTTFAIGTSSGDSSGGGVAECCHPIYRALLADLKTTLAWLLIHQGSGCGPGVPPSLHIAVRNIVIQAPANWSYCPGAAKRSNCVLSGIRKCSVVRAACCPENPERRQAILKRSASCSARGPFPLIRPRNP